MFEIIKFCCGLGILLFSTRKLLDFAEAASHVFKISPLVIGITIVAIGTSLPELALSTVSVVRGDAGLAMGNVIGSNIVNILLVFSVAIFMGKLKIGSTKTQYSALILLCATVIFILALVFGQVNQFMGVMLLILGIAVTVVEYRFAVQGRTNEDAHHFQLANRTMKFRELMIVPIFLAGIIVSGIIIVDAVEHISQMTGISTTVLGMTLTAIATSLPELLTTILSQRNNQEKITTGNIIGSNIYNLLLIGGVISIFSHASSVQVKDWFWLLFVTFLFVFILRFYKGRKPPIYIGILLLIILFFYFLTQQYNFLPSSL